MTQDDMVKVARECGIGLAYGRENIERFYTFVAAEKEQQMIRDGYRKCAEGQRTTQFCGLLDAAVKAEREKVAAWMRSKSYATGHGDTIEDLLKELEWQVAEREREACALLCDEKYEAVPESDPYAEADGDYSDLIYAEAAQDCAAAIRARGEA